MDTAVVNRRGLASRPADSDGRAETTPAEPSSDSRPQPLASDDPRQLGRFSLVARLGQDSAEIVYLGKDAPDAAVAAGTGGSAAADGDGRWVAVTVLHPNLRGRAELRDQFAQAAELVREVRSPQVADLVGVDLDSEVQFVATEFVFGPSVADDVAANGPLPPEDLRALAIDVGRGLAAFHQAGISYLALTPQGVVRSAAGARLADLGMSRAAVGYVPDRIWAGAPWLWSPELWTGDQADAAADAWAWACLVAFAGTGHYPFPGAGLPGIRQATLRGRPSLDGLEPSLRAVVLEALRKDPATRPSCREIVTRLGGGAAGQLPEYTESGTVVLSRPSSRLSPSPSPPVLPVPVPTSPKHPRYEAAAYAPAVQPPAEDAWQDDQDRRDDGFSGFEPADYLDDDRDDDDRDDEDQHYEDQHYEDQDDDSDDGGWRPRGSRLEPAPLAPARSKSRSTRQAGRRKRAVRGRLGVGLVVGVVLAGAAAAMTWRSGASESGSPAGDRATVIAAALGKADELRSTDPDLARRIELAAYRAEPGPATEAALLRHAQRGVLQAGGEIAAVAFSPDGGRVAAGGSAPDDGGTTGVLQLWDLGASDAPAAVVAPAAVDVAVAASAVTNVRFSPDGTTLAASGVSASAATAAAGVLWLWKLPDQASPTGFTAESPTIDGLAFGPDGTLLTDGGDNSLAILDVDDAGNSALLVGHTGKVFDIAFRPDGEAVASASADGTVRVWSFDDPARPLVLEAHQGPVVSAAFSADGALLASLGQDGTVLLWDLAGDSSSTVLANVAVSAGAVPKLAFSPAGTTLAVPAADGTVHTWDVATGTEHSYAGHDAASTAVSFSPDGDRLASGGLDHSVRIWDLHPADVVARLCADPTSGLSREESAAYLPAVELDPSCG